MSGIINKVKEAIHSDKKDNAATNNPRSDNAGPHGSNILNSADPRVDSDRDNVHSHGTHGTTGGIGSNTHNTSGLGGASHGQHGTTGGIGSDNYGSSGNPQSGNAGPHSSNLANKVDPRVDSDLDGGRNLGGSGGIGGATHGTHGGVSHSTHGASGIGSTHGTAGGLGSSGNYGGPGNLQSGNAGPHSSNLANRADPRIDSDLDGGRNLGGSGGIGGAHGSSGNYGGPGNPQSGNAGPHSSTFANSADPRVDSDLDGGRHAGLGTSGVGHTTHTGHGTSGGPGGIGGAHSGAQHSSATPGSGNANKTAGPHNSDLLNKLDPRVDSDVDGSKTYGGNKTHQ